MKNEIAAVLVVGVLLSTSGSSLAAGKLGGAGGADEFLLPPSLLAGKLGGAGGMDEFLLGEPDDAPSTTIVWDTTIEAAGGNE
jgi:hypothetical protein